MNITRIPSKASDSSQKKTPKKCRKKEISTQEEAEWIADAFTKPLLSGIALAGRLTPCDPDINKIKENLVKQFRSIADDGSIREIQKMLIGQVNALNIFFNRMLSASPKADTFIGIETYANIAFRAQNQCRKTLLALADISNPKRATFIKQQNNAINQQVNNSCSPITENSQKNKNPANELLEETHDGKRLDTRTQAKTIQLNPNMEAVDKVYRGKDR